jgi:hypothetical protein
MLRHSKSTNLVTRKQTGQESFFLFGRAIQRELIDTELRVGGIGETDTSYMEMLD